MGPTRESRRVETFSARSPIFITPARPASISQSSLFTNNAQHRKSGTPSGRQSRITSTAAHLSSSYHRTAAEAAAYADRNFLARPGFQCPDLCAAVPFRFSIWSDNRARNFQGRAAAHPVRLSHGTTVARNNLSPIHYQPMV